MLVKISPKKFYSYTSTWGKVAAGGGAYEGPGDTTVVGTATGWWGLRAYSNAKIGSNIVRLSRVDTPATQQDFAAQSDGGLSASAINTFLSGTTGKVHTLYDQTANGCHLVQATDANRPLFVLSSTPTSKPSIQFVRANSNFLLSATPTPGVAAQPSWQVMVVRRTMNTVGYFTGLGAAPYSNTANNIYIGGSLEPTTMTVNVWHTVQCVPWSGTSNFIIDGTDNTGSGGVSNATANTVNLGDAGGSGGFMDGTICELGIWLGDQTSKKTLLHTNMRTYWGTV